MWTLLDLRNEKEATSRFQLLVCANGEACLRGDVDGEVPLFALSASHAAEGPSWLRTQTRQSAFRATDACCSGSTPTLVVASTLGQRP